MVHIIGIKYVDLGIYLLLRNKVTSKVLSATKYLRQYCDMDDVSYIYTEKVWLEKEIKLKEFNFKVFMAYCHVIRI